MNLNPPVDKNPRGTGAVTEACDERSPSGGGEKEEPNEPPSPNSSCSVRVLGGVAALPRLEAIVKDPFYEYNSRISHTGYMVKPVHKVYRRRSDGSKRVYIYYGRYWWRRKGGRLVYAGTRKPARVKLEPPKNPLVGLSIIVEGNDIIIPCWLYDSYPHVFRGLPAVRE